MPLIRHIFWQHKRRYGARRIAIELQAQGRPCGVDRVAKLLKTQGLQAIQPQSAMSADGMIVNLRIVVEHRPG